MLESLSSYLGTSRPPVDDVITIIRHFDFERLESDYDFEIISNIDEFEFTVFEDWAGKKTRPHGEFTLSMIRKCYDNQEIFPECYWGNFAVSPDWDVSWVDHKNSYHMIVGLRYRPTHGIKFDTLIPENSEILYEVLCPPFDPCTKEPLSYVEFVALDLWVEIMALVEHYDLEYPGWAVDAATLRKYAYPTDWFGVDSNSPYIVGIHGDAPNATSSCIEIPRAKGYVYHEREKSLCSCIPKFHHAAQTVIETWEWNELVGSVYTYSLGTLIHNGIMSIIARTEETELAARGYTLNGVYHACWPDTPYKPYYTQILREPYDIMSRIVPRGLDTYSPFRLWTVFYPWTYTPYPRESYEEYIIWYLQNFGKDFHHVTGAPPDHWNIRLPVSLGLTWTKLKVTYSVTTEPRVIARKFTSKTTWGCITLQSPTGVDFQETVRYARPSYSVEITLTSGAVVNRTYTLGWVGNYVTDDDSHAYPLNHTEYSSTKVPTELKLAFSIWSAPNYTTTFNYQEAPMCLVRFSGEWYDPYDDVYHPINTVDKVFVQEGAEWYDLYDPANDFPWHVWVLSLPQPSRPFWRSRDFDPERGFTYSIEPVPELVSGNVSVTANVQGTRSVLDSGFDFFGRPYHVASITFHGNHPEIRKTVANDEMTIKELPKYSHFIFETPIEYGEGDHQEFTDLPGKKWVETHFSYKIRHGAAPITIEMAGPKFMLNASPLGQVLFHLNVDFVQSDAIPPLSHVGDFVVTILYFGGERVFTRRLMVPFSDWAIVSDIKFSATANSEHLEATHGDISFMV
jgi:hypothetical protein